MEAMIYNVWTAGSFDTVYLSQCSQREQINFVLKSNKKHWFLQTFWKNVTAKSQVIDNDYFSETKWAALLGSIYGIIGTLLGSRIQPKC